MRRRSVVLRNNARVYLTITSTASPATDLGYLLHKHPGRAQSVELPVGTAHVFYPEATQERCTAALLLEVDPIGLVRGKRFAGDGFSLSQYVNDRPYAASSMLAVALGTVFRTAMAGRCAARPELAGTALPLVIRIPALPSRGGRDLVHRFFAPLGWTVRADPIPLDPQIPEWGDSRYVETTLTATMPLDLALSQLYVLLPVLDDAKHYWVTDDEVDKLLRAAGGWLPSHPERDLITRRYVAHQRSLVLSAVGRLAEIDDRAPDSVDNPDSMDPAVPPNAGPAQAAGREPSLAQQRRHAVLAQLRSAGAARVVDLGCGEGALVRMLLQDSTFTQVLGVDVSPRALELAERRLQLERMPDSQRARLTLLQSSLTYRDDRLAGFDAAVLMEVIEHLDPDRLPSLERSVFGHARPRTVLVTTPNAEYNARYERLRGGGFRHPDHRFEWTRTEFSGWAAAVADRHGYAVRLTGIGEVDPELGSPSQLAVFTRLDAPNDTTKETS